MCSARLDELSHLRDVKIPILRSHASKNSSGEVTYTACQTLFKIKTGFRKER